MIMTTSQLGTQLKSIFSMYGVRYSKILNNGIHILLKKSV